MKKFFNTTRFIRSTPSFKSKIFITVLVLAWSIAAHSQGYNWKKINLDKIGGDSVGVMDLSEKKGLVLLFLDPDCPITQKYGATFRGLFTELQRKEIGLAAVYPIINADTSVIAEFAEAYQYPFSHLVDPRLTFTQAIGATTTPEVVFMDAQGKILYQGAIDNWFYKLGRYRRVITRNYLKDAISAYLAGESIATSRTDAVGCLIGTGMLPQSGHH